MADNQTLPDMGDGNYTAGQNVPLPADILANSPMAKFFGGSLPTEEDGVPAPDDSVEHDDDVPATTDGDGNAEGNVDDAPAEGEDVGEDEQVSTQDTTDFPAEADIDWEYKVPVKIDGKEEYFTLEELRKGYATAQHLSAKGRELGDMRKQLDAERTEKLQEIVQLGTTLFTQYEADESALAAQYHTIKEQMEKAIEDGDGFEAKELKVKLAEVQKNYWDKKTQKSELEASVQKQVTEAQQRVAEQNLAYFRENIAKVMPDFNQEKALQIREFALKEGIPTALLDSLYEPAAIKVLYDYMTLKNKSTTGAQKREVTSKTVPTKKGTPQKTRQDTQKTQVRSKVLSGQGDSKDHLEFLKGLSNLQERFG